MNRLRVSLAAFLLMTMSPASLADRILDVSYFDDRTHNLITFNFDGDGNEIHLSKGGVALIPDDEYASHGLSGISTGYWVRSSSDDYEKLLYEVASGPIACVIADRFDNDPSILEFEPDVRSFGTWVFHNTRSKRPTFNAYDKNDELLETAQFDDDAVDETLVIDGETIEYGFLGIAASGEIAYVTFPEGAAIDDFYYTPEPTTALLLSIGVIASIRRR